MLLIIQKNIYVSAESNSTHGVITNVISPDIHETIEEIKCYIGSDIDVQNIQ